MGKPKRIPQPTIGSGSIPTPSLRNPEHVTFSFKYFDGTKDKFGFHHCAAGYAAKLIERMKELSKMTWRELSTANHRSFRIHTINFSDTTEPLGFAHLPEQLRGTTCWQFMVSVNEHGRVHGFVIDSVFFVVWIDASHKLYL